MKVQSNVISCIDFTMTSCYYLTVSEQYIFTTLINVCECYLIQTLDHSCLFIVHEIILTD